MKDLNYNLSNILTRKAHLLDSRYDEYIEDAKREGCKSCENLLKKMKKADQKFQKQLMDEMEKHVEEGSWE